MKEWSCSGDVINKLRSGMLAEQKGTETTWETYKENIKWKSKMLKKPKNLKKLKKK